MLLLNLGRLTMSNTEIRLPNDGRVRTDPHNVGSNGVVPVVIFAGKAARAPICWNPLRLEQFTIAIAKTWHAAPPRTDGASPSALRLTPLQSVSLVNQASQPRAKVAEW